jgi:prevent-host-death family protein
MPEKSTPFQVQRRERYLTWGTGGGDHPKPDGPGRQSMSGPCPSAAGDHIVQHDHLEAHIMSGGTWSVAEAKAKFSEVIDLALSGHPQTVTRNGSRAVVIVSADEWERKTRRVGNLAEFFASSPLRQSELKVERMTDGPREIEL